MTLPRFLRSPWTWATVLVLLAGYAAAGFLWVPRLVSDGLRTYFETGHQRKLELGAVTFNPFTLQLEINHFAVPDADGSPLLGFDRLAVKLEFASLLRRGIDIGAIALDRPRIHLVRRADGHLNVMDLAPPPDPTPAPATKPPRLWIHDLAIREGDVGVTDLARHTALNVTLKPVTFALRDFSTQSDGNAYRLTAESTQGESFDWQGTFGLDPLASAGQFKVGHLRAQTISQIGLDLLPLQISNGLIDFTGSYDVAEHGDRLDVAAKLAEFVLSDLGIRMPGETADWITVPRLEVKGVALDLGASSVKVEHVQVDKPIVKAWREHDGSINLTRLFKANGATPVDATPEDKLTRPWTLAVPDIRLAGADVSFEDRTPTHPANFQIAPIDVTVAGFAMPATRPLDVEVGARINGDGRLIIKGSVATDPMTAKLAIDADSLGIAALQPYLDATTALTIKSGRASFKGTLSSTKTGAIDLSGDASINGLRTVDNALQEDFVKWDGLALAGLHATTNPTSMSIRQITARAPYARVIIGPNGATNLSQILQPNAQTKTPEPPLPAAPPAAKPRKGDKRHTGPSGTQEHPAAPPGPPIDINLVRIEHGSMNFADESIRPKFGTGIQDLSGTVKGLSSKPGSRADLNLTGKVDRYAPVTITGNVNFLTAVAHTDVHMSFQNMELTALSPYSGKFAGYRIDKGKLSLDLNYLIEDRKLNARHRIVVNQLQLGDRVESPDATSLPVKLAIALLKDRNGVIDLDLPIEGSLDDPKFRLGPIIWKVLGNLITKIITSPFALLGSLFGGGEQMSYIDFPAGIATLDGAAHEKVGGLVKALDSRPGLSIDIPIVGVEALDAPLLNERKWQTELTLHAKRRLGARAEATGAVAASLATPKDYRLVLEDAYRDAFGHAAEVPKPEVGAAAGSDPTAQAVQWLEGQLKPRFVASPQELDALARERATAVQSALLDSTGIDPGRVFVINDKSSADAASKGLVRMRLALH